jgi:P-type Cu+ transporter
VTSDTVRGLRRVIAEPAPPLEAGDQAAYLRRRLILALVFFVPLVLAAAVLTLAGWLAAGAAAGQAFSAGLAVLIIACPCALGLATPAALVAACGRGAQLGIFIKGHQALESSGLIDTVVFDKTGTITSGQMTVTALAAAPGTEPAELLRYAAAVERASEHPVAAAVCAAAPDKPWPEVDAFRALPGQGARGMVEGRQVVVGHERLLRDLGIAIPPRLASQWAEWERAGRGLDRAPARA